MAKEGMKYWIRHAESVVAIVALIGCIAFWIHTMDGIPDRVSRLEEDVKIMKEQLAKNNTKTDIILEDTKFIKQLIIQKHSN